MGLSVHSSGIVEDVAWVSISLFIIQIYISIYYVLGSALGVGDIAQRTKICLHEVYMLSHLFAHLDFR